MTPFLIPTSYRPYVRNRWGVETLAGGGILGRSCCRFYFNFFDQPINDCWNFCINTRVVNLRAVLKIICWQTYINLFVPNKPIWRSLRRVKYEFYRFPTRRRPSIQVGCFLYKLRDLPSLPGMSPSRPREIRRKKPRRNWDRLGDRHSPFDTPHSESGELFQGERWPPNWRIFDLEEIARGRNQGVVEFKAVKTSGARFSLIYRLIDLVCHRAA